MVVLVAFREDCLFMMTRQPMPAVKIFALSALAVIIAGHAGETRALLSEGHCIGETLHAS